MSAPLLSSTFATPTRPSRLLYISPVWSSPRLVLTLMNASTSAPLSSAASTASSFSARTATINSRVARAGRARRLLGTEVALTALSSNSATSTAAPPRDLADLVGDAGDGAQLVVRLLLPSLVASMFS